ncbi:MAG: DNRLRE domain-containing protein [bacterium]|nr:DNRLRE domain-containing protein [bacterium]
MCTRRCGVATGMLVGLVALVFAPPALAFGELEISCQGTESTGGGSRRYEYTIRNIGPTPQMLNRFYLGTADLDAGSYTNWVAPSGFSAVAAVGTLPAVEAALGIPGQLSVMFTTGEKTAHGVVPPQQSSATPGVVVWNGGTTILQPGETATFGFDNPNASWDVEWLGEHTGGGASFGFSDRPIAGPVGTFNNGWVHGPGDSPCQPACNPGQSCLSECGDLFQGVECVLFAADSGGNYIPSTTGPFGPGDRVFITGCVDPNLPTTCLQGTPLFVQTIQPCSLSTKTFLPSDDTYLDMFSPNFVPGALNYLLVRNRFGNPPDSNFELDALLKFDLSSLPSGAPIASATLNLYYYQFTDTNPVGRELTSYRVTSGWSESTASWNNRPTWAGTPTSDAVVPAAFDWMSWDVTADVQAFVNGAAPNHGWIILDEVPWNFFGIPMTRFRSKEFGSLIPFLEIEWSPVACEQAPFAECLGPCPVQQICVPDASTEECHCVPEGPCTQCGPGLHFIDGCGPFPPVGTDVVANNGVLAGIDTDFDCVRDVNLVLRPCPAPDHLLHVEKILGPIDDSLSFPGTSPVDGHPTGPGLDVVDTEIVSMCLTDGSVTLAAGAGGPSATQLLPSLGAVAEDLATPDAAMAESFFDVFFEVSGAFGAPPLYNKVPLRVESRIDCLPPAANYSHPQAICLPLYSEGTCNGGPNDGNPCSGELNCPGGFCDGQVFYANLVSANHSVNQPVCDESAYAECLGGCPTGETCEPDPGTEGCLCQPIPCAQAPYAECLGECPTGTVCVPDTVSGDCTCEPAPCGQSVFPQCLGDCPPAELCTADFVTDQCRCEPVACPQSPFPECLGECPAGTVCVAGPGGCECQPPPPCELGAFPQCLGDCPAGTVCVTDTVDELCECRPEGEPCTQCGPGPHFIDECGPFPPVGTDSVADNSVLAGIDTDLDCERDFNLVLGPCAAPDDLLRIEKILGPIDDSLSFPGTSPVDGHPTGPGLDVVDTEIVSMCLTDGTVTLAAGLGAPSALPLARSLGAVAEDLTTPDATMAESFFDVFFEISGAFGAPTLYNRVPLRVGSRIHCLPPAASYSHPQAICLPLYSEGTCNGGPNNGILCSGDLGCPGGFCDGQVVFANLVSANHSVNQPVCDDSPFPECQGGCPTGEVCLPDPESDTCTCLPRACAAGPYPECLGQCPAGTACVPDTANGLCTCVTTAACEQSPFPECLGGCAAGETCQPNPETGECLCVGACEQGPFPECLGGCPAGDVCAPDLLTDECTCVEAPFCGVTYPVCDGSCPPDEVCVRDFPGQDCICLGCLQVAPGPIGPIEWVGQHRLVWPLSPCALVYNVYRLTAARLEDVNHDGLADDYGSCFQPDLAITEALDTSVPPPDQLHFYLVTGENSFAEGTLGSNSQQVPRPNDSPCP